MAEKKYSDMTEEEKKQWKKDHYKQQYELTKVKPVTAETASKNENAVYKPPTMTSEEAAEHTKKQNEIVKQNAEQEKRLMANRTDPALYKPVSAKAVSNTEKERQENENLQKFDVGKTKAKKNKLETDLEIGKANNRLHTVRVYKSPTKYNVNDVVTEVAAYKSPASNRKTEEERNIEREISNINRDIAVAENVQKQQQTQENMVAEFSQDTGTSRINFIAEGKKKENENNDPSVTIVNGRQVRAYKSPQTYDSKKGENETRKRFLNDEEKNIYYYYLGKYGEDKANQFLDSIAEELNYRQAQAINSGSEDNLLNQYILGFGSGLAKSGENLQGTARMLTGSDKVQPVSALDYASGMAREDLNNTGLKLPEWAGGASLGQIGYDLLNTTGNMLPSLAVGALTGGMGGALAIGANSAGGAYDEAIREGYTPAQAANYAALTGASEAALGYVLGGIEATGGKVAKTIIQKLSPKIEGALKKAATKIGTQALSEFSEEYLQEVLSPVFRNIAFMEENEIDLLSPDAIYSGILGALNAGVLNLPNNISQYANYKIDETNTTNNANIANTAQETAQAQNNDSVEQISNITPEVQNAQIQENTGSQLTFEERAEQLYREGKSWGEIGKALQAEYYPNETAANITKAARNYIRNSDFYGQKGVTKPTANEQSAVEMQNQLIADPTARTAVNQNNNTVNVPNSTVDVPNNTVNSVLNNANPWGYSVSERYIRNAGGNAEINTVDINNLLQFLQNNIGEENLAEYLKNGENIASLVQYLENTNSAQNTDVQNIGAQNPNTQNTVGAQNVNQNTNVDNTVYVDEQNAPTPSEIYYEQDISEHPNTVGAMRNHNEFYSSLDKYGAQPLRAEQIARDNYFEVPKKLSNGDVMSQEVGYMAGSVLGTDAFMDDVILNPRKYAHEINTDAGSISRAAESIKKNGITQEFNGFEQKFSEDKRIRKDDLTKASLMSKFFADLATKETDSKLREQYKQNAIKLQQQVVLIRTESGQNVQSAQIMQKIDGISTDENTANFNLFTSQSLVEELNKRNNLKNNGKRSKKSKDVALNQDLVNKALDVAGTDAEGAAWDAVYKDLANQTSTGFWQRVNNYRYFAMLSNPATHVRNIDANLAMFTVSAIKDTVKIGVEKVFNAAMEQKGKKAQKIDTRLQQLIANDGPKSDIERLQKKSNNLHQFDDVRSRTAAVPNASQLKFAWGDFLTTNESYADSNKWSSSLDTSAFLQKYKTNSNSDFISTYLSKKIEGNNGFSKAIKTVLEHGAFGSVIDFNSWLLSDVEDGFAKRLIYSNELAQRMKANGITAKTANNPSNADIMNRLRAESMVEAYYNTFNEDNKISNELNKLSRLNPAINVVTETILPFKKVPLNILKTGTDYSVVGLAKSIGDVAKILNNPNGDVEVSDALNNLAKGLTGTGLMALGAFLRSIGKITNGLSDDDDEERYQKLTGEQAYALKLGDGSTYTMDWVGAPVMPLFSGALLYDSLSGELEKKLTASDIDYGRVGIDLGVTLVSSIANPMIEMSMLSNLGDTLTTQDDSIGDFAVDIAGDYANEYVPQMLYGITKVVDNTKRNSWYIDKTDNIPDTIQSALQSGLSKIPGLSSKLPAQIDAWGREKKWSEDDSIGGRIFNAFLSPGKYSSNKTTEQDKLISQLVAKTGDTSLYPDTSSTKTIKVNHQDYDLSAGEYEKINKEKGQTQYKLVGELLKSSAFKGLSSDEQAEVIKDIYSYSTASAKEGVHNYLLSTEWQKLEDAKKDGLETSDYLSVLNTDRADNKTATKIEVINNTKGLTDAEKIIAMKYIADLDTDKYTIFTNDPDEIATLQKAISDKSVNKKGDIESLISQGYSPAESLAKYNTAESKKKYENGEFKFGTSTKQKAKAEALAKKGYDPQTIVTAANAVTSIGQYGTKKNYNTCVKMLETVGITDKKFQKDFWNYYVAT